MRRHRRFALALAACALAACSSSGPGASPTTTAGTTTARTPTTAAAAPVTAPVTAPPATAARTTVPATPAPATTTATLPSRPAGSIGPPTALVTYVESPKATRRESSVGGVMVKAGNPAFDRSFVLTMTADDFAATTPAPGWTLTPLARDIQWTPGSCGGTARVFVGHRWEVYVDLPDAGSGPDPTHVQLVSYDTRTGKMAGYLEQPNTAGWMTAQLVALDDHTVGILFDPDGMVDPTTRPTSKRLALRRIDLATGAATDIEMPSIGGADIRAAVIDVDDAVLVDTGAEPASKRYRWVPGRAPQAEPTSAPAASALTIDGVTMSYTADANEDYPLTDVATNKVVARVHQWRFEANGPEVGYVGWATGRGYFGAYTTNPRDDTNATLSPGVYDAATAAWNWVFAPGTRSDYFLIGLA